MWELRELRPTSPTPRFARGPFLSPRVRRRRRGHLTLGHYLHAVHAAWPSGPYAVGKNYLASTVKRIRLTFLSNVVAYPCRHSRKRIGIMGIFFSVILSAAKACPERSRRDLIAACHGHEILR